MNSDTPIPEFSTEPVTPDVVSGDGRKKLAFQAFEALHLAKTLIYRPDFFIGATEQEHKHIVKSLDGLSDAMKHLEDVIGLNGWVKDLDDHAHNW